MEQPNNEPTTDVIKQVSSLIAGQGDGEMGNRGTGEPTRADAEQDVVPDSAQGDERIQATEADASVAGTEQADQAAHSEQLAAGDTGEGEESAVTVKGLAEKLGLEAKDIYEGLEIPLGDDHVVTLGEWKDRVNALADIDGERESVATQRAEYERNVMQTKQELNAIIQLIPAEQRQAILDRARGQVEAYETEQKMQVLHQIPEWKDQDTMAKDRARIVEMGSEYGFSEQEITYTQDARTVKMLNDFMRLRERVKEAEKAAKAKPGEVKKSPAGNKNRRTNRRLSEVIHGAKQSKDVRTKEAAVSELIRSQG
jgi:hypothetical protein